MTHRAEITCGCCGYRSSIALGYAYAIACPGCGDRIVLGEDGDEVVSEPPKRPRRKPRKRTGYRVHPCDCGSNRIPVKDKCPDCGVVAPSMCQVVVAKR